MRVLLRHGLAGFLAIMVLTTTVQLAAARGQPLAVDTMVICTGSGIFHVLVDENGQPTGGVVICPDYALAFFGNVTNPTPEAPRTDLWQVLWLGHTDRLAVEQAVPTSQARGPPAFV